MSQDKSLIEKIFGKSREDYEVAADKAQDLGDRACKQVAEAQRLADARVAQTSQRAHEIQDEANKKIDELRREGNLAAEKTHEIFEKTGAHLESSGQNIRSH
uniref:ATP synthase F0 subunit B n=2 Tax=Bursaphelenchus xylophilus TaxID=6326 RepID=A0A1I7RX80_BURXY